MRASLLLVPALIVAFGLSCRAGDRPSKHELKRLQRELASAVAAHANQRVRRALTRLAEADEPKVWRLMVKVAERALEPQQVLELLPDLAAKQRSPKTRREVERSARRSKRAVVRRALVRHLAARKEWALVIGALKDKQPANAEEAAWALLDARVEAGVEPLLDRLQHLARKDQGLRPVLEYGLRRLLGARSSDLGALQAAWKSAQTQGGLAKLPAPPPPRWPRVEGPRVVFLLDCSGSMHTVDPVGDGPVKATRLQRAQLALRKVIRRLPASTRINIVAYATFVRVWRTDDQAPRLHALDEKTRADALKFVDQFRPEGVSSLDNALRRAAEIEGTRVVYVLSDGFPTHDGRTPLPRKELLELVKQHPQTLRRIHTLGFEQGRTEVLKLLAKTTGATFGKIP